MRRVALITHDLTAGGGCATMTAFLYRTLVASKRYVPEVFSLATSSVDPWSVRLAAPATWGRGVRIVPGVWRDLPFYHVGASLTELEFRRYRPRAALDAMLARFDLLHFAVGIGAWACVADNLRAAPLMLHVASVVRADRANRLAEIRGARGLWLRGMTAVTAKLERRALAAATSVFALSRYGCESLAPLVNASRLLLGPVGVDTDVFRPEGGGRGGYILSVGRFSDPRKDVRLLLGAYADLCRRQAATPPLVLAGERPREADLRYLSELGLEGRVRLLGYVGPEAMPALYRGASVFVLSSQEEGLGIGVIEAMAAGLPVIGTRCGGPESTIEDGETGVLVPVGDVRALTDALERLVTDPGLAKGMGQAGRARAEERFSLAVTGRIVLDRYDALFG